MAEGQSNDARWVAAVSVGLRRVQGARGSRFLLLSVEGHHATFAHGLLQTHSSDGFRLLWALTGCLAASLAGRSDAICFGGRGALWPDVSGTGGFRWLCPVVGLFAFAQNAHSIMEFAKDVSLPCVAALEAWTYD